MLEELRAAARAVVRRRALAVTVVLTLSVAIGAAAAVFAVVDAVLLKPLPYPGADRLTAVYESNAAQGQHASLVAPVRLEEWNSRTRAFDGLAGSYFENVTETSGPIPERVAAMRTSRRFFTVLGTPAALGRTTTDEEERFGGPAVVVISDGFWRARLNADPSAIGRQLVLAGSPRTIVGVMPRSFRYPTAATDAWIPAQRPAGLLSARQARFYTAVGRLKPQVTADQARDDLASIQQRLGVEFPQTDAGWSARVVALKDDKTGDISRSLWLTFGAVVLVLLAACGNIASLLLAAASRREHEVAIRVALGAERRRVLRQLLLEGLVLSVMGCAGGLLLAAWSLQAGGAAASGFAEFSDIAIDARVVIFTMATGLLATTGFALVPALQITRRRVSGALAQGPRTVAGGRQRLQRALVAAQIAVAVVLLVGSGLLIRTFIRLQQTPPGFDPADVLTFRISAAWGERPEAVANRQLRTLEHLRGAPGVLSVGLATTLPAAADSPPNEFVIQGRPSTERSLAVARQVSAGYFATLRVPLLEGHICSDTTNAPTPSRVVVSKAFADKFFHGETAVGHRIVQRFPSEIVGVVGDVRERSLLTPPEPVIYLCGLMPYWPDPYYLVRTDPSNAASLASLRQVVKGLEPGRAVYDAVPLTTRLAETLSQRRLATALLGIFAAATLMLSVLGVYGMLAQFVSERRREIGLRMALGARAGQIVTHILGYASITVAAGIAAGAGLAYAAGKLMAALVYGVSVHDPAAMAGGPLLLLVIAVVATALPLRDALRIEPRESLRGE